MTPSSRTSSSRLPRALRATFFAASRALSRSLLRGPALRHAILVFTIVGSGRCPRPSRTHSSAANSFSATSRGSIAGDQRHLPTRPAVENARTDRHPHLIARAPTHAVPLHPFHPTPAGPTERRERHDCEAACADHVAPHAARIARSVRADHRHVLDIRAPGQVPNTYGPGTSLRVEGSAERKMSRARSDQSLRIARLPVAPNSAFPVVVAEGVRIFDRSRRAGSRHGGRSSPGDAHGTRRSRAVAA